MESDNVTFYACKVIKLTSGFNLKETIFFTRWRYHPKNSWNIFHLQITPLFRRPQGPQECLEKQNYPLSSNLVVWCTKIGLKTKKVKKNWEMTRKTSKNDGFLTLCQSFLVLDRTKVPNFQMLPSRQPWGSWGQRSFNKSTLTWGTLLWNLLLQIFYLQSTLVIVLSGSLLSGSLLNSNFDLIK